MPLILLVFCAALTCLGALAADNAGFEVAFQWNYINFTWNSEKMMKGYVPGDDIIAGIKIYDDIIYLGLPRVKAASTVTLASIPITANKENPLLSPFPNWEMNSGLGCDAFQDLISMEIDKEGIMWVLDARRVGPHNNCPPRIVLLDLKNKGQVLENFIVPEELCSYKKGCFLNDIVVDGDFAYISDTTTTDPGILVFDKKNKRAWKAKDQNMYGEPEAINFTAQGVEMTSVSAINGVALCCGVEDRKFYYMAMSSFHIHGISTRILKNETVATLSNISQFISDEGMKPAQSGGMICDTKDNIYFGLLPLDAVGKWNIKQSLNTSEIYEENHEIITWPDSFSIYNNTLYLITNSMLKFSNIGINITDINFRIIKTAVDSKSYIHC